MTCLACWKRVFDTLTSFTDCLRTRASEIEKTLSSFAFFCSLSKKGCQLWSWDVMSHHYFFSKGHNGFLAFSCCQGSWGFGKTPTTTSQRWLGQRRVMSLDVWNICRYLEIVLEVFLLGKDMGWYWYHMDSSSATHFFLDFWDRVVRSGKVILRRGWTAKFAARHFSRWRAPSDFTIRYEWQELARHNSKNTRQQEIQKYWQHSKSLEVLRSGLQVLQCLKMSYVLAWMIRYD